MRTYTIKGKEHKVYDLESELPADIVINPDWKKSRDGDWVRADDDAYIQVLKRNKIGDTDTVSTCIGTYSVTGNMDTAEREDRYCLGGKSSRNSTINRENPTKREVLFAKRVYLGMDAVEAYLDVYKTNSRSYAKKRAALLLKTQRIDVLMDKNKENVMNQLEINLYYLLKKAKDEVDTSKNGSDRISALKMLWDAFGVVEKQKVTEIAGVFQGFEPKQLDEAKRPELSEYQSVGDEAV